MFYVVVCGTGRIWSSKPKVFTIYFTEKVYKPSGVCLTQNVKRARTVMGTNVYFKKPLKGTGKVDWPRKS